MTVAGSESQDLPEARFNAALWRFELLFVPNLAGTLERLMAALVPGGRLAVAVWGPPARCPAISLPLATMRLFMELPSVPPGASGQFGLGGEGVIEDELNFAGFTDVQSRRLAVVFQWRSPEQFALFHEAAALPIHGALATVPSGHRDQMRQALLGAARARAGGDGGVRLGAEVVVVVGRSPMHQLVAE